MTSNPANYYFFSWNLKGYKLHSLYGLVQIFLVSEETPSIPNCTRNQFITNHAFNMYASELTSIIVYKHTNPLVITDVEYIVFVYYHTLNSLTLFWLAENVQWMQCSAKTSIFRTMYIWGWVFVICNTIKISVRVYNLSVPPRFITPTSTLIILDITKTSFNNHLALGYLRNNFCFLAESSHFCRDVCFPCYPNNSNR